MNANQWLQQVVPVQQTGQASATRTRRTFDHGQQAQQCYRRAAERLFQVNHWHEYAGKGTAAFQLVDGNGVAQDRPAQRGDYFRIDIPAPDNPEGHGDDWVQVQETGERREEDRQLTWLTVRAALNPLQPHKKATHFFDQAATSTFIIYQENKMVMAAVYGRNEQANLQSQHWWTRLRNWLVYIGACLGFARLQWKALTKGLLQ